VRLPRAIIESVSGGRDISPREFLQRIDELGPGDVIHIQDGDNRVTITAQARDKK
jgi:flagellar motor switch protein FliM